MRHKTAVIGLGNYLLSDEGVGLHAVSCLKKKIGNKYNVDMIEAGTAGFNLLHQFDGRDKIIFIDAGKCGLKPGEFRCFKPGDVNSKKILQGHSLHEFDLIDFIKFARKVYKQNIDITIYCVQYANLSMSEELSDEVLRNLPKLIDSVIGEIKNA